MTQFFSNPVWQILNSDGTPMSGGSLYFYAAGTSTPQNTYPTIADALASTNANSNPIPLDSYGMPTTVNIVLIPQKSYKLVIKNSSGSTIRTVDNISFNNDLYDANGNKILGFSIGSASAVNYVNITNSATGNGVTISAAGTDTNVTLDLKGKGNNTVRLFTGNVSNEFIDIIDGVTAGRARLVTSSITAAAIRSYTYPDFSGTFVLRSSTGILDTNGNVAIGLGVGSASAVNYATIYNSATSANPQIVAEGSDTNISLSILPKGTGNLLLYTGSTNIVDFLRSSDSSRARFSLASISASTIRTFTFPDITGTFLVNAGANSMAAGSSIVLAKVNGTESSNAVTASGMSGVITTSSLTTAAGASYAITWTNTFISATSTVHLTVQGGTNARKNLRMEVVPGSGSATLTIYNTEPTNALNGTILIGYTVL